VSWVANSFHEDAENRHHAALQILAIATTAITVVCALPDDDFDIFTSSTNFQPRTPVTPVLIAVGALYTSTYGQLDA
jgi:hypothetical protein